VLEPIAAIGYQQLEQRCTSLFENATDLRRDLLVDLYRRLATRLGQALYLDFALLRDSQLSRLELLKLKSQSVPSKDFYLEFASGLQSGGLESFLSEYERAPGVIATAIAQWVDSAAHLLDRIEADWPLLRAAGFLGGDRPSGLTAGLSDPHDNGQSVVLLSTCGGGGAYYKPRAMGLEAAFNELLRWCRQEGLFDAPFAVDVLNCGEYGWARPARPSAHTPEDRAGFSRRAGALLRLVQLLQGIDCHFENIVASAGSPILIDAECIMHPSFRREYLAGIRAPIQPGDLAATGLLQVGNGPVDISGLGPRPIDFPQPGRVIWSHVNSDAMTLEVERRGAIDGGVACAYESSQRVCLDGLLEGYLSAGEFVARQKTRLLAEDGPLAAFEDQEVRVLLRPTAEYQRLLARSSSAAALRGKADGVDELVKQRDSEATEGSGRLASAELAALRRGDVPRFATSTSSQQLMSVEGQPRCFARSSFDQVVVRLQDFDASRAADEAGQLRELLDR
jgi:lantibiotic modifying enzyme